MACRLWTSGTSEFLIRTRTFSYTKNAFENVCKSTVILSRPHLIKAICHDDVIKLKHFRVMALCAGNSSVTGEFPAQRPVTRSLDVFFDLRLNKRLSKQSWGWWLETPLRPLYVTVMVWDLWGLSNQPVPGQHRGSWGRLERTCRCTQLGLSRNHLSGHLGPTGKWRPLLTHWTWEWTDLTDLITDPCPNHSLN